MTSSQEWKDGHCKDITFIVTKDCQLACKYCYLVGKNNTERMSIETAKSTVDYILDHETDELFNFESVVFNFIGGEPFLEIDLIDRICDYLKMQMYLRKHHWFDSYRFSITTNGINYHSKKVQEFIRKNKKHLSITITIDGTKRKHDINRIWKSERTSNQTEKGSYDAVVRNIPLWLEQFPDAATKVTISSPDIPYVCESVLHLFHLGIHNVHINCLFEDVWHEGDDLLFEQQMRQLADTIIGNRLYDDHVCTLFERSIGHPMDIENNRNWCGAGLMLAIDARGVFYPCTRFAQYALRDKPARAIGNVKEGINKNIVRPFYSLSRTLQSNKECIECPVASGCAWCQGENYDSADSQTIFQRSTAICKMHKARVRANAYYWTRIDENEVENPSMSIKGNNHCNIDKGIEVPHTIIVLLSTQSVSYCVVDNRTTEEELMPLPILREVIERAKANQWILQFVYPKTLLPVDYETLINSIPHKSIVPFGSYIAGDAIVISRWSDLQVENNKGSFIILRTTLNEFYENVGELETILCDINRLNIIFRDEQHFGQSDSEKYRDALGRLTFQILKCWGKGKMVEVNLITDRLSLDEMDNCDAGWRSVTLAPNGYFYICPSFYKDNPSENCGHISQGLDIKNPLLYKLNHSPLCSECGAFHCPRCVYLNKKKTLEVNIPSYEQCLKAEIELETTKSFYELWQKKRFS